MRALILLAASIVAALALMAGVFGAVHATRTRQSGFLWTVVPLMTFNVILATYPGRVGVDAATMLSPIYLLSTTVILVSCTERLISRMLRVDLGNTMPIALSAAYVYLWIATLQLPAIFGAEPYLSHEQVYMLIIGLGFIAASEADVEKVVRWTKGSAIGVALASVAVALVQPAIVLELDYAQGYIPGLPRLTGLMPHAIMLAMYLQIGMLLLWYQPLRSRNLNRLAWLLLLGCFFVAQSKSAWISMFMGLLVLGWYRHGEDFRRWLAQRRNRGAVASVLILMVLGIVGLLVLVASGVFSRGLSNFLDSDDAAKLSTMTGRDVIWRAALHEFQRNPVFGYGPKLFDDTYRQIIDMDFATHGHNQVIDTLARSGLVGLSGLLLFMVVLTWMAFVQARATKGLSLALWVGLFWRTISEVPLNLQYVGPEILYLILMLALLSAVGRRKSGARAVRIQRLGPQGWT